MSRISNQRRNFHRLIWAAYALLAGCNAEQEAAYYAEQHRESVSQAANRLGNIYEKAPDIDVVSVKTKLETSTIYLQLKSKDQTLDSLDYQALQKRKQRLKTGMCREIVVREDSGITMMFTIFTPQGRVAFTNVEISYPACTTLAKR